MDFIKPGKGKPGKKAAVVKQVAARRPVDEDDLPVRIEVAKSGTVGQTVPGSVWRQTAFKWRPEAFATQSDELNEKFIEAGIQDQSLVQFMKKPSLPMIYGVSGNPDDTKAKLFAAYLMDKHCRKLGSDANPWWIQLTGGFDNPYLDTNRARPTMIVLCGLTPQSTNTKLEKARDILEAYPNVPRIIVIAGADPMSFVSTRLHVPVHGLAYFCEAIIKSKIEVV
jgi:hypothetical protein